MNIVGESKCRNYKNKYIWILPRILWWWDVECRMSSLLSWHFPGVRLQQFENVLMEVENKTKWHPN